MSGGTPSGRAQPGPAIGAMGRSATAEAAGQSVERLAFFSDAVVAIAMTLLALELPVPDADSGSGLADFVADHLGEYLAFLISFFVIAQYWRGHHRVYRYVTDAPPRLVSLNIFWLLTVVVTPYATRVIYGGEDISHGDFPWRFGFYALVQAFAALTFFLAQRYLEREGLLAAETPPDLLQRGRIRNLVLMTVFGVSIPLAFVIHGWAFVAWSLIPVAIVTTTTVVRRRHLEAG
ncbi:MAG TPA: TMEM175 family protein [Lapillicoccus sp.]